MKYKRTDLITSLWLVAGRWFPPGTPVSSTNNTDHYDIAEIFLKMAWNTIILTPNPFQFLLFIVNKNKAFA